MKEFLKRIDRFLDLVEHAVRLQERTVLLQDADFERAKVRDEEQKQFFQRQAEAAENIASSSNAQTHIAKRTSAAIERSAPPKGWDPP